MKRFTILLLLESMILIPLGTSLNNSEAFPQEHANKTNDNIPFKFPMPVESLNSDKILSRSNQYDHKEDHLLPNTKFTREHSILKATIIPESKIIKKTKFNMSTDPSTRIENKAPAALLTSEGNGRNTYALQFKSQNYPIIYQITGSGNKLRNVSLEKDNATLQVNIDSKSNGTLTIQIPKLSYAQKNSTSYTVFEDGQYYSDFEQKNSTKLRQLQIHFDRGTGQVEILAGHTSPEFSVTSIVFALPVIIFIILTRNQKKIRRFR